MEGTLDGLGHGQAGRVAASTWGAALGIQSGRISWPRRQGCPSPGEEADLPRPGRAGSASLGGGSRSLCPWLQPAFGPASVDQMCAQRRREWEAMAVHGLHPCRAATCPDRGESALRIPGENRPEHLQQPSTGHPSSSGGGFAAQPRGTQVTQVAEPAVPAGMTGAHSDGNGAGPAWRGTKLKACGDRLTLPAPQECSGAWHAQLVHPPRWHWQGAAESWFSVHAARATAEIT